MDFLGPKKKLDDLDLPRIGHQIGVGEDVLHAFMDVEASGRSSDNKGRLPMLYEPHVMYRNTSGQQRATAVAQGLAYEEWRKGYPADSYPRLAAASKINEEAALRSSSWGSFQLLGENYKICGYPSARAMVLAFCADEENQLDAVVKFIKARKIDDELRAVEAKHKRGEKITAADFATVAKVYNGPKYATHNYHGRMAAAFNKWIQIADTEWSPGMLPETDEMAPTTSVVVSNVMDGQVNDEIRQLQIALNLMGYFVGEEDGRWGGKTLGGLAAFMLDRRMEGEATVTQGVIAEVRSAVKEGYRRPIAVERATATPEKLEEKLPEVAASKAAERKSFWSSLSIGGTGIGTVVLSNLGDAVEFLKPVKEFATDVPGWVWGTLAVVAALIIFRASQNASEAKYKATEAYQEGARV